MPVSVAERKPSGHSAITPAEQAAAPRLQTRGNQMQCPQCEQVEPMVNFKCFSMNEKYVMDLAYVWQHRRDKGGCGHCFAMADQRIIAAYLSGDWVPRSVVEELRTLIGELKDTVETEPQKPVLEISGTLQ